ncbi:hypothetical protein GW626_05330 [Peribacillus muralis]|uniref:family 4 glycosyl hydrolase n=1 Tax=Peribacillus muralis TaxID=264697 RepID=UPI001F4EBD80|nr:hypothetical protein [Peribacillus muralis]MCK1992949.1 hypothetical protein [Peribacillus muralis]MCK2013504.1 hypothetical protein [Peribacillus muralis]
MGKNRKKIVLIGAGSAVFTQGLLADFIQAQDFGSWEVGLVDIDKRALDSITLLAQKMVSKMKADITISSSLNRRELLPGADVVVTTIAVGGRRAWENDVYIPRKYGIFQPVGDTTMPGGISRALRMIPAMIEVANDIKELCPDAHFFNYSNPMTAIISAVRKVVDFPVIGLCHGSIYLEKYLSRFLSVDVDKISSIGVGLNHLTFLYDLRVNGKDAWPTVNEVLNEQKEKIREQGHNYNFFNPMLEDTEVPQFKDNPFSWAFYEKYGAVPAVLDRHVVEFFPERFQQGAYYDHVLGKDAFPFEAVIERGDNVYNNMIEQADGDIAVNSELFNRTDGEHEQLVEILRSLYQDERKTFYINCPNNGAVPNLPANSVLEMPAVATGNGFYKMFIPDFPDTLASIVRKRLSVVDLTVEAAISGDRNYVVEAMLLDGAVTSEEVAEKLTDELLEAHKQHLPQFFGDKIIQKIL